MTKRHQWLRGELVRVACEGGTVVSGQVWDKGPRDGEVWLALDDGTFLLALTATGDVLEVSPSGHIGQPIGKVA